MLNFQFYNPTRVIFGQDTIKTLPKHLPHDARILIVYGGSSAVKSGLIDEIKSTLGEAFHYMEFAGVEPNPQYETLMKAVDVVKKNKINFLLAVGGGSVVDGTKFIALAALYHDDPWQIVTSKGRCAKDALALGVVLTLPATGSEMNCTGVITRAESKEKIAFNNEQVYPQFSILDPTKTYSLPERQLANGLVDSFVHVLEQYLTYPVDAKIPDYFSESVMRTLIEISPDVMHKKDDYTSRANFMWAATIALNGILATGVPEDWTTHRIGHELTALYGIDHARTLAIILPALWTVKRQEKSEKLRQYAERVWNIDSGSDESKIDQAIINTVQFFQSLGVKTKLADYGIEKDIDLLIERLEHHGQTQLGERENITLDVSRQILALI